MPILDNMIAEQTSIKRVMKLVTYEGGEFKDPDGNQVTPTGTQGAAAGFRYTIDLSATTAADPGAGKLRFNHATLASVTAIYIDNTTVNGSDISAFIDTWENSVLTIKANDNLDASFATFTITGVADSTGYRTLTVTYIAGNSFSADEAVVAYIAPKGAAGDAGTDGDPGAEGARGRRAGLPYTFSTTTGAPSDPGSGVFRFDAASIASVTAIYIDILTSNATDISAYLALWTTGDTLIIGSDTDGDTSLAVFTVVSTVDSTGYYTINVSYVSGTTFSASEACVIQRFAKGSTGDTGLTGDKGGIPYQFSTTTTAADPGEGFFRLNNADASLATALYIDDIATGSMDVSAWLAAWQSGGQLIILSNVDDDNSFAIYTIGTVTDSTGYFTVALTHVAGAGFSNNEACVFQYSSGGSSVSSVSNVNAAGVGVYKQTDAGVIQMRGINAGSSKVTVTLDSDNNEIDIDVAEANLATGGRATPLTAKMALTFSTGTADNDPTTGRFKFNNATIGSITKVWIDYLDSSSRNLANEIGAMVSGDKLLVYDSTGSTLHTIATLSSTATDKTGYWEFTVTCAGGTGALPANLAACTVVYQSKTLVSALLSADNFARFESNGAGGYNLIDNTGAAVESAVNVYALSGKTISGVSTIPAASSVPLGTEALLHPDNFVGDGYNTAGVKVISDGTNWRPSGKQVLFQKNYGSVASPTMTKTGTGRFTLTADPIIPANLLYAGARIRILMSIVTTNAAATTGVTSQIWMGTDTTTYGNNSRPMQSSTSGTANAITVNSWPIVTFLTTTTAVTSRASGVGGAGGTGGYADLSTLLNTAADMMVTFEVSGMGSATSVMLAQFEISWEY